MKKIFAVLLCLAIISCAHGRVDINTTPPVVAQTPARSISDEDLALSIAYLDYTMANLRCYVYEKHGEDMLELDKLKEAAKIKQLRLQELLEKREKNDG